MGLTTKEWFVDHDGHAIRVVNSWFSGAKLYVDGDCRDTNNELFSLDASRPVLSGSIEGRDGSRAVVEVYIVAIVSTQAMICVDGRRVAGDLTAAPPPRRLRAGRDPYRVTSATHAGREVDALTRRLVNARTLVAGLALALAGVAALVALLRP